MICRLDQLSRNEELQEQLKVTDWDLIVCDEAHKMSASYYGDELDKTRRYQLGEMLGGLTRHFLLLSATPHNGKEADFQLFMALLDGDRFEGKYRQAVHTQKADDLMRRMVKEQLVKMDGTPLFPERRAYTVTYSLSDNEAILYDEVSKYVRDEFNRAESIGDDKRAGNVGFALTVLQRRLASSPEAIYQSLVRRHDRLTTRLDEERVHRQADDARLRQEASRTREQLDDIDEGLATNFDEKEDELADRTTAALTLRELEAEIGTLKRLMTLADDVRRSGHDKKWEELSTILQERVPEVEEDTAHRKLVIFTEHRDTLNYLRTRISNLIGRPEAIVTITGGMARDDRRKAQEAFTQDKSVEMLLATDAAGEGINLQRAHLMVNYDLPWNPNRLRDSWQWLLAPWAEAAPGSPIKWEARQIRSIGDHESLAEAAGKRAVSEEFVISQYAGTMLRMEIDKIPSYRDGWTHVALKDLGDWFSTYLYLPRLKDPQVLTQSVTSGVQSLTWELDTFGYADAFDVEQDRYRGLTAGRQHNVVVNMHGAAVIVHPDVVKRQMETDASNIPSRDPAYHVVNSGNTVGVEEGALSEAARDNVEVADIPAAPKDLKRYFGSVELNPQTMASQVQEISREVVNHLHGIYGAQVKISLEIQANVPNGIPDDRKRVVVENSRQLKFDQSDFAEE